MKIQTNYRLDFHEVEYFHEVECTVVHRVITSDSEWYNEWQRMKKSGTTNGKVWQRVTSNENEWQWYWTNGTTNDKEWQRVTTNDNEWQRVITNENEWYKQ